MRIACRLETSPSLEPRADIYFARASGFELKLTRDDLMERSLDQDLINFGKQKIGQDKEGLP
jgi:hypothetical protein